jgi:hypothetical protein
MMGSEERVYGPAVRDMYWLTKFMPMMGHLLQACVTCSAILVCLVGLIAVCTAVHY